MDASLEEPRAGTLVTRSDSDGIVTLTLNRPAQFNALSRAMLDALHAELVAISADASAKVIVLAALGKAFCAGHDLREMRAHGDEAWQRSLFDRCSQVMLLIEQLPQVVIARVHGLATAAGCQLVAACDLAIAARSAQFATSGINLGLFCSTPAVALSRNLAPKHAAELLFSGRFIDAVTAAQWGLVNRAVDDATLDAEVDALAVRIAGQPASALRSGKALLRSIRGLAPEQAYARAAANMACDMQTEDAQLGIDAFLDKRPRTPANAVGKVN